MFESYFGSLLKATSHKEFLCLDSGYLDIQNNKMVPAIFLFLNFCFSQSDFSAVTNKVLSGGPITTIYRRGSYSITGWSAVVCKSYY